MGRIWAIAAVACGLGLGGCATLFPALSSAGLPSTPGERASNYGYVPLDPLSVAISNTPESCAAEGKERTPCWRRFQTWPYGSPSPTSTVRADCRLVRARSPRRPEPIAPCSTT